MESENAKPPAWVLLLLKRTHAFLAALVFVSLASCGGGSPHPGEADNARSVEAKEEVLACAKDAGWDLEDLQLAVDGDGLLIGIQYRAHAATPGAPTQGAVIEACLAQADVTRPSA